MKIFKIRIVCQVICDDNSTSSVQCHKYKGGWIDNKTYTCNKCGYKL